MEEEERSKAAGERIKDGSPAADFDDARRSARLSLYQFRR